jgi:hypothetical protein
MGLGSFVVVLLWCGSGFVVVKRGELTVVWHGEGRDWRGFRWFVVRFFRCIGGRALGMVFGVGFVKFQSCRNGLQRDKKAISQG